MWNGTVPWLPTGSFQPPQPQWHPAHHPQAAAVWWPCRSARGCALHSPQTACRKTICSERKHWVGPSPLLPGGVWIIQLYDGGCLPVACVPLSELVWERAVHVAPAVGVGALPEDMSQQVLYGGKYRGWAKWWRYLGTKYQKSEVHRKTSEHTSVGFQRKFLVHYWLIFISIGYDNVLTKVIAEIWENSNITSTISVILSKKNKKKKQKRIK